MKEITTREIGRIFYFKDSPEYRKRIVEVNERGVYTVEMDHKKSCIPVRMSFSMFREELEEDNIEWVKEEVEEKKELLSSFQEEKLKERWESIGKRWKDSELRRQFLSPSERSALIKVIGQELGINEMAVRTLLTSFWRGGMRKTALLPKKRGPEKGLGLGRGRIAKDGKGLIVTKEVERLFEKAYRKYHLKEGKSVDKTYSYLLRDHYCIRIEEDGKVNFEYIDQEKTPTLNQFRYWVRNHKDQEEELRCSYGDKEFENSYRILTSGTTVSVGGAGVRAELDATHLPIELVSERDSSIVIGTPLLQLLVDVYTKMVMGFYLGLENESYMTSAMAVLNSMEDKKEFASRNGVRIEEEDWPVHHIPSRILSDHGPFCSRFTRPMEEYFNCSVESAAPRKGSDKGNVERKNKSFEDFVKDALPGTTKHPQKGRGAKDPADEACLNLRELRALIIQKIVEYNHSVIRNYPLTPEQIAAGLTATPLNLWNDSIEKATDQLNYVRNLGFAEIILLPRLEEGRKIRREGLRVFNFIYTSSDPEIQNWMINHMGENVEIAYDPADVSHLFIIDKNRILRLELNPAYREYEGMSLREVKRYQKQKRQQDNQQDESARLKSLETIDLEDKILKEAKSKDKKQKKNKKGNRREEIRAAQQKSLNQPEQEKIPVRKTDEKDRLRSELFQKKIDEVIKKREKNE